MSEAPGPLREVREALAGLTRRLDELSAGLARLGADRSGPALSAGEPLGEDERRQLADLGSLLSVGPGLGRDAALVLALDRVVRRVVADCAALFVPTDAGELVVVAQRGWSGEPSRLRLDEGIVGRAFRDEEPIIGGPSHRAADPLLSGHGLGQALAVPVRLPGQPVVGVLFAGRRRAAAFGAEALEAALLVADRVALVLSGAEPRPTAGPPASSAPEPELGSDLDLGRTAAAVAREAAARLGAPRVGVLLPDGDRLRLAAGVGLPAEAAAPDAATEALHTAVATGRPWVAAGEADEPGLARLLGAPARLVAPLRARGHTVALVVAGGPTALQPTALAGLAEPAAVAIWNARLYAETAAALAEARRPPTPSADVPAPVRDLGTLLAVLLARIGLVRERVRDPAVAGDLAVAEEAAWRAVEAVRAVLGFAPGRRGEPLAPLDLGALVASAVERARARWGASSGGAAIELDLEPLPPVRGSAEELAEALDHLLANAAEATPTGGRVVVRGRWDGGRRIDLVVEDSGPGMDDEVRRRAIEPFFTSKGPGRLGLGLAVAQGVLARHHGTLEITGGPGQGTAVRLVLPPATAARGVSAPIEPARILVIEDDAPVREALVELLRQRGHVTLAAADGPEGLAVVEREPVDVVFTDLTVAHVSGFDVARTVKRLRPGTPVILITGWPGRLDQAEIEASGIDRVIEKPVGAAGVLAALEAALAQRRGGSR